MTGAGEIAFMGESIMNRWGHFTISGRGVTLQEMKYISDGSYARGVVALPPDLEMTLPGVQK